MKVQQQEVQGKRFAFRKTGTSAHQVTISSLPSFAVMFGDSDLTTYCCAGTHEKGTCRRLQGRVGDQPTFRRR